MSLNRPRPFPALRCALAALAALALAGCAPGRAPSATPRQVGGPVRVGELDDLGRRIAEDGPVFFPDLSGGDRGFWLARSGERLVALSAEPATAAGGAAEAGDAAVTGEGSGTDRCPVAWDRRGRHFVDCRRVEIAASALPGFEVIVGGTTGDPVRQVFVDVGKPVAPGQADPG